MSTTEFYPEGRDEIPNSHYTLTEAGADQAAGKVFTSASRAIEESAANGPVRNKDVSFPRDQGPFPEPDNVTFDSDDDGTPDNEEV